MSDKKRKNSSKESQRPSKKPHTASHVRVKHVVGPKLAKPVIATSSSTIFPDIAFQSFTKPNDQTAGLLLHSSGHSMLDHTGREDDSSIENHLKHYVAVFSHETGRLQITEAKHLTIRSALKSVDTTQDEENRNRDDGTVPASNYNSRQELTAAFGTKKSKKAVQSVAENRLLAQGHQDVDDPVSANMLSKVEEDDEKKPEISLADTLSNKPLPTADLKAIAIDQVYSLDTLVLPHPGTSTLERMPVNTWVARISAKKEVKSRFRFVANRVGYVAKELLKNPDASDPELETALKVLRYTQVLLDLHAYITRLPRRKPIPPTEDWPDSTMSEATPMSLLRPIMRHFFPDHMPKEYSITLLRTTILALTLHVPPPSMQAGKGRLVTELIDISLDMAVDIQELRKLYRELGCSKVAPASEAELKAWGFERLVKQRKDAAGSSQPKPIFAQLKFPLEFAKLSRGPAPGRR